MTKAPPRDLLARVNPSDTLGHLLANAADQFGSKTFLTVQNHSLSYVECFAAASRFANLLRRQGIRPGDRVAIMMENAPEYVVAWFGANLLGAVEVSINTAFKGQSLQYILSQSGARAIVAHEDYAPVIRAELPHLTELNCVIVTSSKSGGDEISWAEMERESSNFDFELNPTDISMFGYTSGTTGPSKGAMVPHNRIVKTGHEMALLRGIGPEDNLFTCLPLFHGNAKYHTVLPALVSGCQATLTGRFSASRFWDEIRESGATQFNYLGVTISILLKSEPSDLDRAHNVKLAFGAGAQSGLLEQFEERFGVHLMEAYGLTEGGIALANRIDDRRAGSCGKPMPGYEVAIVDDLDNELPAGEKGELVLRSHRPYTTMLGYYQMPAETTETYRNFWLHTGDLAWYDEDGFFFFVDRKKDAIRRRGENISTFEIEAAVNTHPDIFESAAFAVPADVGEDDVMVVVVPKEGATIDFEALAEFCTEKMPYFWVPRYLRVAAGGLPRTPTNKVEKFKLRDRGVDAQTWDRETSRPPQPDVLGKRK